MPNFIHAVRTEGTSQSSSNAVRMQTMLGSLILLTMCGIWCKEWLTEWMLRSVLNCGTTGQCLNILIFGLIYLISLLILCNSLLNNLGYGSGEDPKVCCLDPLFRTKMFTSPHIGEMSIGGLYLCPSLETNWLKEDALPRLCLLPREDYIHWLVHLRVQKVGLLPQIDHSNFWAPSWNNLRPVMYKGNHTV